MDDTTKKFYTLDNSNGRFIAQCMTYNEIVDKAARICTENCVELEGIAVLGPIRKIDNKWNREWEPTERVLTAVKAINDSGIIFLAYDSGDKDRVLEFSTVTRSLLLL
jgi:hypothetical protein